jgi:putative ABC transport system permease protein
VEAVLFALIGAGVGAGIAWAIFNGNTISTLQGGGQVVAELRIGWDHVALAAVGACVVGLVGGLFPAVRAARIPVADALRAL